jgi:hypothetical protein
MTDNNEAPGVADRFDPFVRGLAIGALVVLLGFVLVAGIVYFSSDYEFARVLDPGAP